MAKKYGREHIKVWKKHHGAIPKDADGRSYEIHHIDGNPKNNSIENLICVSINEHYNIHLNQQDYGGAFLIARRMKIKPENLSETIKLQMKLLVELGKHNFLDPNFPRSMDHNIGYVVAIDIRTNSQVRIKKEDFDLYDYYVGVNKNRKQKTVHSNRGHNKDKSWTQKNKESQDKTCKYCDFVGRGSHVSRYHNERCKNK